MSGAVNGRVANWGYTVRGDPCNGLIGSIALLLENMVSMKNENLMVCPGDPIFQFVSAITCTGFTTADIYRWTPTAHIIPIVAMIAGGTAGSTSGGIKTMRAIMRVKGIGWWLKKSHFQRRQLFHFVLERELSRRLKNAELGGFRCSCIWYRQALISMMRSLRWHPHRAMPWLSTGITTASPPCRR